MANYGGYASTLTIGDSAISTTYNFLNAGLGGNQVDYAAGVANAAGLLGNLAEGIARTPESGLGAVASHLGLIGSSTGFALDLAARVGRTRLRYAA